MKCKKCGWVSKYPVCDECATDEERKIIAALERVSEPIKKNNRELFKRHLRFPTLTPLFYISIGLMLFSFAFSFLLSNIVNMNTIMLWYLFPLSLFVVMISVWGDFPEENIENGLRVVELKHQNKVFKRRKRKYLELLSKPYDNWTTDEKIEIKFNSYETAMGEPV